MLNIIDLPKGLTEVKFRKEPKVITVNDFTEKAFKEFSKEFSEAHNTGQDVIPIVVESYGGYVYQLNAFLSLIESSDKIIATINPGIAASAGSVFLAAGTKGYRFASEKATVMVHEVASAHFGKVKEIEADAKETSRLNEQLLAQLDDYCGKVSGTFSKMIHDKSHADWHITSQEAKKLGLIDHIGMPKLVTTVSIKTEFTH